MNKYQKHYNDLKAQLKPHIIKSAIIILLIILDFVFILGNNELMEKHIDDSVLKYSTPLKLLTFILFGIMFCEIKYFLELMVYESMSNGRDLPLGKKYEKLPDDEQNEE